MNAKCDINIDLFFGIDDDDGLRGHDTNC